jgi:5-methylcytosine-specific restriction protein A
MGRPLTPCPKCRRLKCEHPRRKPREGPSPYTRQWRNLRAKAIGAQPWCSFCGTPGGPGNALQGDHIIPVSLGGTNTASNIRVLCRKCNQSKGGRERLRYPPKR